MIKAIRLSIIFIIIAVVTLPVEFSSSIAVGLKKGNWIEYNVEISTTQTNGSIIIPLDHNISWARLDVIEVQGTAINLSIQTEFSNGTILSGKIILDLETGTLGDDFIIPANLTQGDFFFDKQQGNITIANIQIQTVAGAERTILLGITNETRFYWDQLTGLLIYAESTFSGYSLITSIDRTNLWAFQSVSSSPETNLFGIDYILLSLLLVGGLIFLVLVIIFFKHVKEALNQSSRKHNNS